MKEQADGQANNSERPRTCQPEAASEQAAHAPRILDRHTEALHHEVQRRPAISRVCHEAEQFVVEAAVEKNGQKRDLGAGARETGRKITSRKHPGTMRFHRLPQKSPSVVAAIGQSQSFSTAKPIARK